MRQLLQVTLVFVGLVVAVFFLTAWRVTKVEPLGAGDVSPRFQMVYARFADTVPMLSRDAAGYVTQRKRRQEVLIPVLPEELTVLVWRGPELGLVRMEIPLWMLRMPDAPLRQLFRRTGLDPVAWQLDADAIQEWGPGIVIDHHGPRDRVLAWTE